MVETQVGTGLTFSVLGPLSAYREGRPLNLGAPKQRAVIAVLVANSNQPVGVGRIITAVWGDDASQSYRRSIQTYISNLRAILDSEIPREGDSYRLAIDPSRIDAIRFEEVLEHARGLTATDPDQAAARLRDALAMWRGRPYADVSDVDGLQTEIHRLDELRLNAVELRIDAELAAGRHRELIAEVEALADEHPLRERFRAQHMIALYRAGRQAEALRVYEKTRNYLAEELGLDPSRELQDLELAILDHDRQLTSGTGLATTQRLFFLSTSIVGLNEAWDRNPQAMAESLWVLNRVVASAAEANSGRVFQETGEGHAAVFQGLGAAVLAAEQTQKEIVALDWGELEYLRVGVALDVGEAESQGEGFSGPPVSRAQRLASMARGGQVLLSSAMQEELAGATISGLQVRQLGEFELAGFAGPERIAQLVIEGIESDFDGLRPIEEWLADDGSASFSLPGYEIRELIGRGSIGVVYRAYQPSVGREVAIKVIRPTMSNHPRFFHRFEAEARVIARLAHPHIVPLIDFWRDSAGAYLVLQYLPGGSLKAAMETTSIDITMARRVIRQIALALEHAHSRGVPHGDVSPSNILLDEAGNAFLSDFDITSRLLEPDGGVSIPPRFQAPELSSTGPTAAADIYAFGRLVELLVGAHGIEDVIHRATSSRPDMRFPSALDLLEAFERAMGGGFEVPVLVVPRNPYKGLRPFEEADYEDFYGREALVGELVEKVKRQRFVTVVGPSGSGKSSLVRAGLLPALARGAMDGSETWPTLTMTPGQHPLEALVEGLEGLATAPVQVRSLLEERGLQGATRILLGDPDRELVLVIDQFEELFAQAQDLPARRRFIEIIVGAVQTPASPVRVVVTLRADFYQPLLAESDLNEVSRGGQVTVLPPTREELIEMITRPAESVGLRWEAGLPERIAGEVLDQPGGLPLLQYALTETVEVRNDDRLTAQDYERAGGVSAAVVNRAESIFAPFEAELQPIARQVFLRLVQVDPGGEDTRRRVRRSELESLGISRKEVDMVVDPFIAERLLLGDRDPVTRGPTIEVAHEALLANWPRLADWIDDERDSLVLVRRLGAARDEWEKAARNPDFLLTGARLAPFAEWATTASLTSGEREYLELSEAANEQRARSQRRRRRALVGIVSVAATIALVLAGWAIVERNRAADEAEDAHVAEQQAEAEADRAESEAERAERNARLARSRELAASAVSTLDDDPELATLLALESIRNSPSDAGASAAGVLALRQAVASDQLQARFVEDDDGPAWARISDDGSTVYAWAPLAGVASAIDVATGARLWTYEEEGGDLIGEYSRIALSPDEQSMAIFVFAHAVGNDAAEPYIVVLRTADGRVETVLHPGPCLEPEFSREGFTRDGRWLLVLAGTENCGSLEGSDDWVSVYDTATWEEAMRLSVEGGAYERATFSDTGDRVLISSWNGSAHLRSLPDLELVTDFGAASLASLSPDGNRVVMFPPTGGPGAFGVVDQRPGVHDAATGRRLFYLDAVDDFITGDGVVFSRDGSKVVITTRGHDYVFSMVDGRLISDLGETGPTDSAWFTGDGTELVTATDGSVLLWDVPEGSGPVGELIDPGIADPVWANPNWALSGPHVALQLLVNHETAGLQNAVVVLDDQGSVRHAIGAKGWQLPDGRFGVNQWDPTADDSVWGPLVIWDPAAGEITELGGCRVPSSVLYDEVALECPDGEPVFGEPRRLSNHIVSPADGSYLATKTFAGRDGPSLVQVWDTETMEVVSQFEVPFLEDLFDAGPDWLVTQAQREQEVVIRQLPDGDEVIRFSAGPGPILQLSHDASILYAGDEVGGVWAFDTSTWSLIASWKGHDARVRGLAPSPDGLRLVTTAQDDLISVWDLGDIREMSAAQRPFLLDRIPAPFPSDAVWLDEERLGVILADGPRWMEVSLSVDDLVSTAVEQLTRSFTPSECATFGIDPCPTQEELAGR